MMDKKSNEHIPCTWCDRDAEPGTIPPRCRFHMVNTVFVEDKQDKRASEDDDGANTLKELADKP